MRKSISASEKIQSVFDDIHTKGFSSIRPFSIGMVERKMRNYANANNIDMANGGLYMSYSSLAHSMRTTKKNRGNTVTEQELIDFPKNRKGMDLYYDKGAKLFFYVDEANKAKYVVHPSYELQLNNKKKKAVNFITASRIKSTDNFHKDRVRYDKI